MFRDGRGFSLVDYSDYILRGIEKESLRVDTEGSLAQTPHPDALGAPLTHSSITTDFSEALIEFITPAENSIDQVLSYLSRLHSFTANNIGNELLWSSSMPCVLHGSLNIPIAKYGSSNAAKMKETYRLGLGHRYGRAMQTISGIHYNFSLTDDFWEDLQSKESDTGPLKDFKTTKYLGLIRNFKRHTWLLLYLFGASPAVCKSFLKETDSHKLEELTFHTLGRPDATTLRMSELGYQSRAQESLFSDCNSLDNYIESLQLALTTPFKEYENPDWEQLNQNIVQIENEIYSNIRPKQPTESGEPPVVALKKRGIEYIEVRCLDLNPYLPLGIDKDTIKFLDAFLLFCLFDPSPELSQKEDRQIKQFNHKIAFSGRTSIKKEDALKLLTEVKTFADEMGYDIQTQFNKVEDPKLTPSGKINTELNELSFFQLMFKLSKQHRDYWQNFSLTPDEIWEQKQAAIDSKNDLKAFEACPQEDFATYLSEYYLRAKNLS